MTFQVVAILRRFSLAGRHPRDHRRPDGSRNDEIFPKLTFPNNSSEHFPDESAPSLNIVQAIQAPITLRLQFWIQPFNLKGRRERLTNSSAQILYLPSFVGNFVRTYVWEIFYFCVHRPRFDLILLKSQLVWLFFYTFGSRCASGSRFFLAVQSF